MKPNREPDPAYAYDLVVGSVFRDEAPYLREWIEFHKMMGVQRFLLVNDRSTDNFADVLRPYVDAGEVDLLDRPCPPHLQGRGWIQYQLAVTSAILDRVRGLTRWLAIIDIDEFIVPAEADDLIHLLREYDTFGGIYIRWEPFGTSYVAKFSAGDLVTDKLRMKWKFREGDEMLGKSIVKPDRVCRPNIHRCDLLAGVRYADSNYSGPRKLDHRLS